MLAAGILLLVPMLMLLQSGNKDKGTSKGYSVYNLYHVNSNISEYAMSGSEEGLLMYLEVLRRDANTAAMKTWLTFGMERIGTPAIRKAWADFNSTFGGQDPNPVSQVPAADKTGGGK